MPLEHWAGRPTYPGNGEKGGGAELVELEILLRIGRRGPWRESPHGLHCHHP